MSLSCMVLHHFSPSFGRAFLYGALFLMKFAIIRSSASWYFLATFLRKAAAPGFWSATLLNASSSASVSGLTFLYALQKIGPYCVATGCSRKSLCFLLPSQDTYAM